MKDRETTFVIAPPIDGVGWQDVVKVISKNGNRWLSKVLGKLIVVADAVVVVVNVVVKV